MRVTYEPDDETLRDEVLPLLWAEDGLAEKLLDILRSMRQAGYMISREVEVTGPMARGCLAPGRPSEATRRTIHREGDIG